MRKGGRVDALRNKFKRTAVEFEPQGTRGASTVTCIAEMQYDGVRVGQLDFDTL